MKGLSTIIVALLLSSTTTYAHRKPADTNYVRLFPQTISVRAYLGEKISTFRLADKETDRNLQYRPNNVLGIGLGVTIRGLGLNFSTSLPFHDKKVGLYGTTKHLDVQMHRYARKLMLDAYFQQYKGFHLNDKNDVSTIIGPEEYP
jgi:hypothetical protein